MQTGTAQSARKGQKGGGAKARPVAEIPLTSEASILVVLLEKGGHKVVDVRIFEKKDGGFSATTIGLLMMPEHVASVIEGLQCAMLIEHESAVAH